MLSRSNILLTRLFLKIDFRNKDNAGFRRLIGIIVTYLFANTLITNNNYLRLDKPSFAFVSLTVNFFFVAFILISDYAQLFFSKNHVDSLKSLPVKQENIFTSKIISSFIYLSVFPFVVSLPPSVYMYFYGGLITDSLLFFVCSFVFSYFIIGIILLANSFVILAGKGRSKALVFLFQILFLVFVFSMNRTSGRLTNNDMLTGNTYFKYLPQYYLADGFGNPAYILALLAVTILLFAVTYFFLRNKYFTLSEIVGSVDAPKTSLFTRLRAGFDFSRFENIILRGSSEKASYGLFKNLFFNNASLKLRLFPVLLIPVISTLVGVVSGISPMLVMTENGKIINDGILIVSPAVTITTLMCIRLLYANTKMALDTDGNIGWLYDSLPVERRKFANGVLKFIYVYFLVPVIAVTSLLLLTRLPAADVFLNQIYLFAFGIFVNSLLNRFDKTLPFTVESTKFNSSSKYIEILVVTLFGIVFFVSQIFIFKSIIFVLLGALALAVISYFLNK
ncbi:MAG: hypothetical protein LWX07_09150 [Bacteroidetes bacterium]|nr:hypothetical protein [Bacteroidota bacterium]